MNIPDFTAEASLYRTSNSYRSLAFDRASPQRTVVSPQLPNENAPGLAGCMSDCRVENPGWTAAQCRAACRDPGSIPGSGGRRKLDPSIKVLCTLGATGCLLGGFDVDLAALCLASWFTGYDGPCSCGELMDRCLSD